jgi:hypothetical protein
MLDAGCWMLDAGRGRLPSIQHPASSIWHPASGIYFILWRAQSVKARSVFLKPARRFCCMIERGIEGRKQEIVEKIMPFEKLIDEKIREAIESGEFDNLSGKGKPLDLEGYFATPADVRLGYSMLKSAGCVPEEVALQKEIEILREKMLHCEDEAKIRAMSREIESKTLKLNLLMDSNRRRQRTKT